MRPYRSVLFVPAHKPRWAVKALAAGADAIVIDLEDSVPAELYLRSRILLACREANIHPLTALWEDLDNLDGLRDFAKQGRQLGFRGMIAIHPSHVPLINQASSPSDSGFTFYEGLISAYETAATKGEGALRYRGLHVNKAHYDKAVDWLAQAREQLDMNRSAN